MFNINQLLTEHLSKPFYCADELDMPSIAICKKVQRQREQLQAIWLKALDEKYSKARYSLQTREAITALVEEEREIGRQFQQIISSSSLIDELRYFEKELKQLQADIFKVDEAGKRCSPPEPVIFIHPVAIIHAKVGEKLATCYQNIQAPCQEVVFLWEQVYLIGEKSRVPQELVDHIEHANFRLSKFISLFTRAQVGYEWPASLRNLYYFLDSLISKIYQLMDDSKRQFKEWGFVCTQAMDIPFIQVPQMNSFAEGLYERVIAEWQQLVNVSFAQIWQLYRERKDEFSPVVSKELDTRIAAFLLLINSLKVKLIPKNSDSSTTVQQKAEISKKFIPALEEYMHHLQQELFDYGVIFEQCRFVPRAPWKALPQPNKAAHLNFRFSNNPFPNRTVRLLMSIDEKAPQCYEQLRSHADRFDALWRQANQKEQEENQALKQECVKYIEVARQSINLWNQFTSQICVEVSLLSVLSSIQNERAKFEAQLTALENIFRSEISQNETERKEDDSQLKIDYAVKVTVPLPSSDHSPTKWLELVDRAGGIEVIKEELLGRDLPRLQEMMAKSTQDDVGSYIPQVEKFAYEFSKLVLAEDLLDLRKRMQSMGLESSLIDKIMNDWRVIGKDVCIGDIPLTEERKKSIVTFAQTTVALDKVEKMSVHERYEQQVVKSFPVLQDLNKDGVQRLEFGQRYKKSLNIAMIQRLIANQSVFVGKALEAQAIGGLGYSQDNYLDRHKIHETMAVILDNMLQQTKLLESTSAQALRAEIDVRAMDERLKLAGVEQQHMQFVRTVLQKSLSLHQALHRGFKDVSSIQKEKISHETIYRYLKSKEDVCKVASVESNVRGFIADGGKLKGDPKWEVELENIDKRYRGEALIPIRLQTHIEYWAKQLKASLEWYNSNKQYIVVDVVQGLGDPNSILHQGVCFAYTARLMETIIKTPGCSYDQLQAQKILPVDRFVQAYVKREYTITIQKGHQYDSHMQMHYIQPLKDLRLYSLFDVSIDLNSNRGAAKEAFIQSFKSNQMRAQKYSQGIIYLQLCYGDVSHATFIQINLNPAHTAFRFADVNNTLQDFCRPREVILTDSERVALKQKSLTDAQIEQHIRELQATAEIENKKFKMGLGPEQISTLYDLTLTRYFDMVETFYSPSCYRIIGWLPVYQKEKWTSQ